MRTLDGKRPVFIDDINAVFFFPYLHVRFVEIPPRSLIGTDLEVAGRGAGRGDRARADRNARRRRTSRSTRTSSGASARSDPRPSGAIDDARRPLDPEVRVREGPGATLPAVSKNLVIVESPAKARTIERYLGADYRVLASYGHVRDLPENPGKGKFGVDVDHDFEPEYVISDDRRKQVNEIEKAAKSSDLVFLATDLDREGEAIAWHVAEAAHVPSAKTRRVTFSEITESAIREAFAHPRDIDQNLVDAQQTRRIVDRLVGYTLSPLLSRKVRGGLSAGRVQSVAVRLVVEREREIDAFTAREYWTIEAILATAAGDTFAAELVRIDGEALDVADEATAERHVAALRDAKPVVRKIGVRTQKRSPAPPFTTSTLQQEASRKLSFSPKRTMSIAQRLYEGADTPDGHVGLITYMRTDSTAIAGIAMGEAREVIAERYGEPFTMPKGRVYKTKSKGAQEAHESIRPTSFRRDPDSLANTLKPEELRLYRLIWQRALASQMAPKELETTTVELADGPYELRASSTKTLFEGFARVYTEGRDDDADEDEEGSGRLPTLAEGDATDVRDVTPTQHFTEPPPRFTEATLIKALEEHGIGRPSTYAATISTIVDRGYVRVEERRLYPEPVAGIVTDLLVEHFGDYVDLAFTARMEEELDEIARGERAWVPLLRAFYAPLRDRVAEKRKELKRSDFTTEETDEVCSLRATPWSSASGATAGSSPARCTRSTRSRGRCPATSRRPRRARARSAPSAARARWSARTAGSGRSSAARATPSATTSRRTARRRRTRCRSRSSAPRTRTASWSRVARGGPATSSGGAPSTPSATSRRTTSRSVACTTPTTARWRARARRRSASICGSTSETAPGRHRPGRAVSRAARPTRRRWPDRPGARSGGAARRRAGRRATTPRPRAAQARSHEREPAHRDRPPGGVSAVAGDPATHPTLERFLRSLAARDASPHTIRAYTTAVGAYLAWLERAWRGLGAAHAPGPARLPRPPRGPRRPGRPSPSGWPRSARSTAGRPARASRRATRGAPSPRPGCRAGCRASWRSTRSTGCSPPWTRS